MPEIVIHASHGAPVSGMCELDSVGRASSARDTGAEAKHESSCDEVARCIGRSLHRGTNKYKQASDEYANSTSVT